MPRPTRISLSLVEGIDGYSDLFNECARDGVIESHELRSLQRRLRPLQRMAARLDESLRFVDLAIHGNGIYGDWFEQKRKEAVRDRLYLVRSEDDDPEPSGPSHVKAA